MTIEEDVLIDLKHVARLVGMPYSSLSEARYKGRILIPEVRPIEGGRLVRYRLSDVMRVVRGEAHAIQTAGYDDGSRERAEKLRVKRAEAKAEKAATPTKDE